MTRHCEKCGQQLADGAEVCPNCGTPAPESGAALFTTISAETENWHEQPRKKPALSSAAEFIRINSRKAAMVFAGVLVAAVVIFAIMYTRPVARVGRSLRAGEYEQALEIYRDKAVSGESSQRRIGDELMSCAAELSEGFARREVGYDRVKSDLATLEAFGLRADELSAVSLDIDKMQSSHTAMDDGLRKQNARDWLAAADSFLLVIEADADYEAARAAAGECLNSYAEERVAEARKLMSAIDYTSAMAELKDCNDVLFGYDTFSEDVDSAIEDCRVLYEAYALSMAETHADNGEYSEALALIEQCISDLGEDTEALAEARDKYSSLTSEEELNAVIDNADKFYEDGSYSDAFLLLMQAAIDFKDNPASERALKNLEERFNADMISDADAAFAEGGDDAAEAAVAILRSALGSHETPELRERLEYYEGLVPVSLIDLAFTEREGTVFRSADGWMWGGNGESITFALDGGYDYFTGVFGVVRDDYKQAQGSFEVWCDGKLAYASGVMKVGDEAKDFRVDISGCNELKIVFGCNYTASTAEDGYCYHTIKNPVIGKNYAN